MSAVNRLGSFIEERGGAKASRLTDQGEELVNHRQPAAHRPDGGAEKKACLSLSLSMRAMRWAAYPLEVCV